MGFINVYPSLLGKTIKGVFKRSDAKNPESALYIDFEDGSEAIIGAGQGEVLLVSVSNDFNEKNKQGVI